MVLGGKNLPVYNDCGTCTADNSLMAVTIMIVSLAARTFKNLETLVNFNAIAGQSCRHFSGGLNLDTGFLILGLATDSYFFSGENNGQIIGYLQGDRGLFFLLEQL